MEIVEYRNLIGGELRPATSGATLDSINPATGQVWARIPASGPEDIDAAVAAAARAQPAWAALPVAARAHFLQQVAQVFIQHGEELAKLETYDNGRIIAENNQRAGIGMAFVWNSAAGHALEAVTGRSVDLDPTMLGFTLREPLGVIGAIIPWNAPVAMTCNKSALALAAGNAVVVKPAEQASVAVLRMCELVAKILPPGVFNVVSGLGSACGEALVRHPKVRKITMTGSTATGKRIQAAGADTLTSAVLELGGKSPNIVFADADLDAAAVGVSTGSVFTGNAGQVCVAGSRILVERPVVDEMIERIRKQVSGLILGDPLDSATSMGPIISQAQFDRVTGYVEAGKRDAKLLFGGRYGADVVPSMPGGYWVEPTLFLSEDNSISICQEEIFGPVAALIPFDTEEQALAIANDCQFGLASGLWTRDMARIQRLMRGIEAGNVWVNIYRQTRYELPFGGIKDSGYGHDDILEFTREKSVVIAS